jgi:hypothetical protein
VERRRNPIGHRLLRRLRDFVPEHGIRAGRARELDDDLGRGPSAQQQRGADGGKALLEGPQRLRQPPARGGAKRTRVRHAG